LKYVVSRRTREIGIRMALRAQAADVRRMVITQSGRVALVGGDHRPGDSAFLGKVEGLLFDIQARDPIVVAAVSVVMLGVALLASYLPARRASGVDPVEATRVE
jgi:ABC-type antimicrobial peptide transport system permease subunit